MHLHHDCSHHNITGQVRTILRLVLIFNILVAVIKFFVGYQAHSLSIFGDAAHSSIDSLNNIVALFMIKLAAEPPDQNHPYGHSKFETLGALIIVAFLAIASFELIEKSIVRFFNPGNYPVIEKSTIVLLVLTLFINTLVWLYENAAARKYHSHILKADAAHTFSDILVTISILFSVFFIARGYTWLDPLLGLVIAGVILNSGREIIHQTIPILVDEAWIAPDAVSDLITSTDKVIGFSNFRSRKVHDKAFLEMNVRFNTDSLAEAHQLSHTIENKIIERFGQAQITIHIEP